jgi:hypothetical protein
MNSKDLLIYLLLGLVVVQAGIIMWVRYRVVPRLRTHHS